MKKFLFLIGIITLIHLSAKSQLVLNSEIPQFSLIKMDSSVFESSALKKNMNTIIIHFSPHCEHCQKEITDLLENYYKFKNTQFILASSVSFPELKFFEILNNLKAYPNITFAWEPNRTFTKVFNISYIPYVAIFDTQQHLIKTFEGESKVDDWLKLIN